jgi:hypothetical protein
MKKLIFGLLLMILLSGCLPGVLKKFEVHQSNGNIIYVCAKDFYIVDTTTYNFTIGIDHVAKITNVEFFNSKTISNYELECITK